MSDAPHSDESTQLARAVLTLFKYLDAVEESDEGREFHPTTIGTCRSMDAAAINDALVEMKRLATAITSKGAPFQPSV